MGDFYGMQSLLMCQEIPRTAKSMDILFISRTGAVDLTDGFLRIELSSPAKTIC